MSHCLYRLLTTDDLIKCPKLCSENCRRFVDVQFRGGVACCRCGMGIIFPIAVVYSDKFANSRVSSKFIKLQVSPKTHLVRLEVAFSTGSSGIKISAEHELERDHQFCCSFRYIVDNAKPRRVWHSGSSKFWSRETWSQWMVFVVSSTFYISYVCGKRYLKNNWWPSWVRVYCRQYKVI